MAFPSVVTRASSTTDSNVITNHTVTLPGSLVSGNLIVAAICFDNQTSALAVTWPAGWTELLDSVDDTRALALNVAYRVSDGSEGASITVTTNNGEQAAHRTWQISGQHPSSAPEIGTTSSATYTSSPDPPSVTASWGSDDTLWLALAALDNGGVAVSTYPTSYSQGANITSLGTGLAAATLGVAERENATATENPATFALTASCDSLANTIAIRPAAAASGSMQIVGGAGLFGREGLVG
jgi:hypothetical protein